jgi:hypothetical protein
MQSGAKLHAPQGHPKSSPGWGALFPQRPTSSDVCRFLGRAIDKGTVLERRDVVPGMLDEIEIDPKTGRGEMVFRAVSPDRRITTGGRLLLHGPARLATSSLTAHAPPGCSRASARSARARNRAQNKTPPGTGEVPAELS